MNNLYKSVGISKQGFHQWLDRMRKIKSEQNQVLWLIGKIREDHPTMGLRDMYFKLNPETMGRDAFERFCKEEGLMLERKKDGRRTTDSTGVIRFDNLIEGLEIDRINQVWQSDITYFEMDNRFYYITFVEDSRSRRIVGHNVSDRLTTEQTTLPALEMAISLRIREGVNLKGLIIHSDGGGQYYDKEFLKITGKYELENSMCEYAWENGKVERLNGVIKNNYLRHREINGFEGLKKELDRTVYLYNHEKPHIALQRKSPVEYENNYIHKRKNAASVESAPETKTQPHGEITALRADGQKTSGPNGTGKSKRNLRDKKEKTVNLI